MINYPKRWAAAFPTGLALLFVMLFVSCSSVPLDYRHPDTTSSQLTQNIYLKKSWPEAPIQIYISDKFPEEFRSACIDALDKWNEEAGAQLFNYKGTIDSETESQDGLNVIYWDNKPSPNGYFGAATTYWVNDDVLIEGDIVVHGKPSQYSLLTCEDGADSCRTGSSKRDFNSVILHELGHVLGFGHSANFGDVMFPGIYAGDVSREFSDKLIAELSGIYQNITVSSKETKKIHKS